MLIEVFTLSKVLPAYVVTYTVDRMDGLSWLKNTFLRWFLGGDHLTNVVTVILFGCLFEFYLTSAEPVSLDELFRLFVMLVFLRLILVALSRVYEAMSCPRERERTDDSEKEPTPTRHC
jgi:hypothetical protein